MASSDDNGYLMAIIRLVDWPRHGDARFRHRPDAGALAAAPMAGISEAITNYRRKSGVASLILAILPTSARVT